MSHFWHGLAHPRTVQLWLRLRAVTSALNTEPWKAWASCTRLVQDSSSSCRTTYLSGHAQLRHSEPGPSVHRGGASGPAATRARRHWTSWRPPTGTTSASARQGRSPASGNWWRRPSWAGSLAPRRRRGVEHRDVVESSSPGPAEAAAARAQKRKFDSRCFDAHCRIEVQNRKCRCGPHVLTPGSCRALSPGPRQPRNTANRRRRAQPRPDDDDV